VKKNNLIKLAKKLFPIYRSITGKGNRETLYQLKRIVPNLKICKVKSGERFFDWQVPPEWNIKSGTIKDKDNKVIIDFKKNNLHVVGYSTKIKKKISLKKLRKHLFYIKKIPKLIPYVTSYYKKFWGFCLSYNEYKKLNNKDYYIEIDSDHKKGFLNYGEIIIKGKSKKEVFISTYICHPGMVNNEISGPIVSIYLAKWLMDRNNFYTYRFVFLPETIGSIIYIKKNFKRLIKNVCFGLNITCVGDNRTYSFLPTKFKNLYIDRLVRRVLKNLKIKYKEYDWLTRGSDERQYSSPNVNLPFVSIMRSKYGTYKEYHTSGDDFKLVTNSGLNKSLELHKETIKTIEQEKYPISKIFCEPNMGKRKLYPTKSQFGKTKFKLRSKMIMNFLTFCDGTFSINDIRERLDISNKDIKIITKLLLKHRIIQIQNHPIV
tara:strand:- start:114 stop:1409 length:1296 start_codon:yes stop_codon:yes gene_type:complete